MGTTDRPENLSNLYLQIPNQIYGEKQGRTSREIDQMPGHSHLVVGDFSLMVIIETISITEIEVLPFLQILCVAPHHLQEFRP